MAAFHTVQSNLNKKGKNREEQRQRKMNDVSTVRNMKCTTIRSKQIKK